LINKPLYFKMLFYMIGTILLAGMTVVVGINLANDSRLFNPGSVPQAMGTGPSATTRTLPIYKQTDTPRVSQAPVTVPPLEPPPPTATAKSTLTASAGRTTAKPSATATATATATPVVLTYRIEFINRCGSETYGASAIAALTGLGHDVTPDGATGTTAPLTQILVRKSGVDPDGVRTVLGTGTVTEDWIPGYSYDITVILGTDYIR
jgi:hypothetical protein